MQENQLDFPIDAAILTPHARPMLAIDHVLSAEGGSGQATFSAKPDAWYMSNNGRWDEITGIELISQAAAAISGLNLTGDATSPPVCFLAEIRKYQVHGDFFAGDDIVINIQKDAAFGGFFITKGTLLRNETLLAEAELTFWREEQDKAQPKAGA